MDLYLLAEHDHERYEQDDFDPSEEPDDEFEALLAEADVASCTPGEQLYLCMAFRGMFAQFWPQLDDEDREDFEAAALRFLHVQDEASSTAPDGEFAALLDDAVRLKFAGEEAARVSNDEVPAHIAREARLTEAE